jgi:hypothetical protein
MNQAWPRFWISDPKFFGPLIRDPLLADMAVLSRLQRNGMALAASQLGKVMSNYRGCKLARKATNRVPSASEADCGAWVNLDHTADD